MLHQNPSFFRDINTLYDLCSKYYVDAQISKNEPGTAADMVKHITDKYPVILVADRGYESYNLFANVEERLFDYVIRIKNNVAAGILSGLELPDEDEFDIEKNIVITRHGTGPAMVNRKNTNYFIANLVLILFLT